MLSMQLSEASVWSVSSMLAAGHAVGADMLLICFQS